MSKLEIFTTKSIILSSSSFYPRYYLPESRFVRDEMINFPSLSECVSGKINGGSTPAAHFFLKNNEGIPFIKTSAVTRHLINVNDLQSISKVIHQTTLKRAITKPYDVIYTMTGKFMGKAALCPHTIPEMNMSQNSVVLRMDSPKKAAFLTIFLNSRINRIQVRSAYSITKQKYLNQGKIAELKVVPYDPKYDDLMSQYITACDTYFSSVEIINDIIHQFNTEYQLPFSNTSHVFCVEPGNLNKIILTPNYYRADVNDTISLIQADSLLHRFNVDNLSNGDEIGSENYLDSGIPFIKTSDIINYDVDYEPDCYCTKEIASGLMQDVKKGDVLFTKDGKPGEVALLSNDKTVVISSGIVRYRPTSEADRYWVFLLLTSKYGDAYFKKWFVIGSTMSHLRSNFFDSFMIPQISKDVMDKYILPLKNAFESKNEAYDTLSKIHSVVEQSFIDKTTKLAI